MAECVVPNCARDAQNNLGVRLRRPDTSAIWAPNTEAFVCDYHAESGALVTVYYQEAESNQVDVRVHGTSPPASRVTPIHHRETGKDLSEDLTTRLDREP